jgi:protein-S-isoprenylcysteine O-methyltransferase Ste14
MSDGHNGGAPERADPTLLWRQMRAVIVLPGVVLVLVPTILLAWKGTPRADLTSEPLAAVLLALFGLFVAAAGLGLVGCTVALLQVVGGGTLAPWDPAERLVVSGPYLHLRNPIIVGVAATLLGEAMLFRSWVLLLWAAGFLAANLLFIPWVEEPGLERRFGDSYRRYRDRVPRWIPRLRPAPPVQRRAIDDGVGE